MATLRRDLPRGSRLLLAALSAAFAAALSAPGEALAGTWCGNDVSDRNRTPEAVSGYQIHVVYAFPSDGADRFASLANPIVTDLETIDAWWRSQDPSRTPRFDEFAFPGCAPGPARLDLSKVRLPNPSSHYANGNTTLQRLFVDLGGSPFGFAHDWAKYLVYYDGAMFEDDVCGMSHSPTSVTVGRTIAAVFLQTCPDDTGQGGYRAWTAAHELVHNLGAVQRAATGSCPEPGHTCDNEQDLMGPFVNTPMSSAILDHNRDDWYGHGGAWADVQDSPWLLRLGAPRPQLTVVLPPSATGARVESEPPGISCPPQCSIDWDAGSEVRLAVTPPAGLRLVRWQGACTNREELCMLTLGASTTATAVFGPTHFRLSLAVSGTGAIRTSLGKSCARRCISRVSAEDVVVLRALPRKGYRFVRWSGACRGTKPTCRVRMTQARSAAAIFARRR